MSFGQVVINGFEVIKELGCGGFTTVHLVRHQRLGKQFAMSVIPCGNDNTKFNRFLNEILSRTKQHHPAIVEVEQCFVDDVPTKLGSRNGNETLERHICIVMEYCEGGDLRSEILRMIQEDRKCEEEIAWKWLHQACSALELMHSKRVIHRDIKPENILLSGENPPHIKITGFEISEILMSDQDVATEKLGTMRYAAPDLYPDSGYDQRVDMWGVGVTFFELLTRGIAVSQADLTIGRVNQSKLKPENKDRKPFWERALKNPNFVASCKQSFIDNGYSRELSELVSNLMEPDPNKRRSAREVVEFIDDKFNPPTIPFSIPTKPKNPVPTKNFEIKFKDLSLIKQGGFGVVWLAKWNGRGGGMTVAVKKLTLFDSGDQSPRDDASGFQLSEESRQEFKAEMEIMFSLSHPHVVKIFGACIGPTDPLCIVEEFAERGSLFDILHNESIKLEWWLRWRMAKQATMGLNYLHNCDPVILHRNIKSLNFLVYKHWNIKICDFGLAKVRLDKSPPDSPRSCSSSGSPRSNFVGTMRWSAPESLDYPPVWSTKSDVYSLGITMWEIASRQVPFEDIRDNAQIPKMVCFMNRRPQIPENCPAPLSNLIQQCWSADPKDRPSCDQILEMMRDHDHQFPEQENFPSF